MKSIALTECRRRSISLHLRNLKDMLLSPSQAFPELHEAMRNKKDWPILSSIVTFPGSGNWRMKKLGKNPAFLRNLLPQAR